VMERPFGKRFRPATQSNSQMERKWRND
jgi:hypothetical protein